MRTHWIVAAVATIALAAASVGAVAALGDDASDGADAPAASTAVTNSSTDGTTGHDGHADHSDPDTTVEGEHTGHDPGDGTSADPTGHDGEHDESGDGGDTTDHEADHGDDDGNHDDGNHDDDNHDDGNHDDGTVPHPGGHHQGPPTPEPDPCAGHVPTPNPADPCNQAHCSSDHDPGVHAHVLAASTQDCAPEDPCAGHVHTDDPNDPCNPPCGDDHGGGGGHEHALGAPDCPTVQYGDLPPEVQALVDLGTNVAIQYPTAADAEAAGWYRRTIYFPGIATHYLRTEWLDGVFDPAQPEVLLYGRDGQLVGFNYIIVSDGPPEGFPGEDDRWHEHPTLCLDLNTGLIIGGEDLTVPRCARRGGTVIDFSGRWLLHVWTVPGYDSPEGVFSHENSRV